jgi:hypothetical protein
MQKIKTRSIEECQELVRQWHAGLHDQVVEKLGAEPTTDFLESFKPIHHTPNAPKLRVTRSLRSTLAPGISLAPISEILTDSRAIDEQVLVGIDDLESAP